MNKVIRRGFATLAATGLLGAGLLLGTGTASANGGHHYNYNNNHKVEWCWQSNGHHWGWDKGGYWVPCNDKKFYVVKKYDHHGWCKY